MGGCRVLAIIKILKHHQMATTGGRGVVVFEGLPTLSVLITDIHI
jgi:hypothetical protein